ncbi:hypothetical protein [uncultured Sulfitobacter sp.]|uniref:hypothetical protein n=1 Tax=uncultured Sulfitobacter sp. TaxID=191468 RepID=UPI00261F569A|nr:hypothetical protein [uncultured Sulfitobacter sp.]
MTDHTPNPKNDSSDETVIGFKGAEQHHDLKGQAGENGDPSHAHVDGEASAEIKDAVDGSNADGAVSDALKDATKK